MNSETI